MKKISIILVLLTICETKLYSQVFMTPQVSASYTDFTIRLRDAEFGKGYDYSFPCLKVRTGLSVRYRSVSVEYASDFYCKYRSASFVPMQASFCIGASWQVSKSVSVSLSHCCLHPIRSDGDHLSKGGLFGGGNQVTVSFCPEVRL